MSISLTLTSALFLSDCRSSRRRRTSTFNRFNPWSLRGVKRELLESREQADAADATIFADNFSLRRRSKDIEDAVFL
ncbi:hypothetical protein LguiA_007127 [Lonicera macranthoides]